MKTMLKGLFALTLLTLFACGSGHELKSDTTGGGVSDTNGLSSLVLSSGTLSPSFSSSIERYSASVTVSSIEVTPKAISSSTQIKVNDVSVSSGHASSPINLVTGSNAIDVHCVGTDGGTKDYIIIVTRTNPGITESTNNYLKSLSVSDTSISPSFLRTRTSYSASVDNSISSTYITAETEDDTASIQMVDMDNNSTQLTSGSPVNVSLNVGANVYQFIIESQSGIQRSYVLIITRSSEAYVASGDNDLSNASIDNTSFTSIFSGSQTFYTTEPLDSNTQEITFTAIPEDSKATVTIDGETVDPNNPVKTISISSSLTFINVVVTAENGESKTYTFGIYRAAPVVTVLSSDASLRSLYLSETTISYVDTNMYIAQVDSSVTAVTVNAETTDADTTITIGSDTAQSSLSKSIELVSGTNIIRITTTAPNGNKETNIISVTKVDNSELSSDTSLDSLSFYTPTQISPEQGFPTADRMYSITLDANTSCVDIVPVVHDQASSVTVNSNSLSQIYNSTYGMYYNGFNVCVNQGTVVSVKIEVTAQNGNTQDSFVTIINPAPVITPATLSSLSVHITDVQSSITQAAIVPFTPNFDASRHIYQLTVASDVSSIDIVPRTDLSNATITVNDNSIASLYNWYYGTYESVAELGYNQYTYDGVSVPLNTGLNEIEVKVTDQDGNSSSYYILATRTLSNAELAGLSLHITENQWRTPDAATISYSPDFAADTYNYYITVASDVESIDVAPVAVAVSNPMTDPAPVITVNGTPITSIYNWYYGTYETGGNYNYFYQGVSVPLTTGNNEITVTVTNPDGATKNYYIHAVRSLSTASLSNLSVHITDGATVEITPTFPSEPDVYYATVASTVESIDIVPVAVAVRDPMNDPVPVITVNGTPINSIYNWYYGTYESNNNYYYQGVSIPLSVGSNEITINVTNPDGATKNYYVHVIRSLSTASLSGLSVHISDGATVALNPEFATSTYSYGVLVDNSAASLDIVPTFGANATVTVNDQSLNTIYNWYFYQENGSTQYMYDAVNIPLNVGVNHIVVHVANPDGVNVDYYIEAVRLDAAVVTSNDVSLSSLAIAEFGFDSAFDPSSQTYSYHASAPYEIDVATITAVTTDANATVTISGQSAQNTLTLATSLNVNTNIIYITVNNNTSERTYTIAIDRAEQSLNTDASLSTLTLSDGTPVTQDMSNPWLFTASTTATSIGILAIPNDPNATVTINEVPVDYAVPSADMYLPLASTTPSIVECIAQDGITKSTYFIQITQIPVGAENSNFTVSISAAELEYDSDISFRAETSEETTLVTVTPEDPLATITVSSAGQSQTPLYAEPTLPISLAPGNNMITVTVLAEDGIHNTTKFLFIHRTADINNALLEDLIVSNASLSPTFASHVFYYAAQVTEATVTITPTAADEEGAIIKVNGQQTASGTTTEPITVDSVNNGRILIEVTARDGLTKNTYTVDTTTSSTYTCESEATKSYIGCDVNGTITLETDKGHYFQFTTTNGDYVYTKGRANLKINSEGVLVDSIYGYVLMPQINLPVDIKQLNITSSGQVQVFTPYSTMPTVYGQIPVVYFQDPDALLKIADSNGILQQQVSQSNLSSLSTSTDETIGSYYQETAESGLSTPVVPNGSLFADQNNSAIKYCGKLSNNVVGGLKLRVRIIGNGLVPLVEQGSGNIVYYASNFSTRTVQSVLSSESATSTQLYVDRTKTNEISLITDANGNLVEESSGLQLQYNISIPANALFNTVSINEIGEVTVNDPWSEQPISSGYVRLSTFQNLSGLTQSEINPNIFIPTASAGPDTTDVPGSSGLGTLNQYSKCIYAPTIIAAMPTIENGSTYQASTNDICSNGQMTIEVTDLTRYLKFTNPNTQVEYYKRGEQEIKIDEATRLLTDVNGYILDSGIQIPVEATKVIVLSDGMVLAQVDGNQQPLQLGTIQLYSTVNGFSPDTDHDGYYVATSNNGAVMSMPATGSFYSPSIAFCRGRVLSEQGTLINDKMTAYMSIEGAGFFQLRDAVLGTSAYTRNNKFYVDQQGYIREASSGMILEPGITIPEEAISFNIDQNGNVTVAFSDSSTSQIGQIQISKFADSGSLYKSIENKYILYPSVNSGTPLTGTAGQDGFGAIVFGGVQTRSDYNDVTNVLFHSESGELQNLDAALWEVNPLNPAYQLEHPTCFNYSQALSDLNETCAPVALHLPTYGLGGLRGCEFGFILALGRSCGTNTPAYQQFLVNIRDHRSCFDPMMVNDTLSMCGMDDSCVNTVYSELASECGSDNLMVSIMTSELENSSLCMLPQTAQAQLDAECNGDSECTSSFIQNLTDQCGADNFVVSILNDSLLELMR